MTSFSLNTEPSALTIGGVDVSEHVRAVDVYVEEGQSPEVQVWVKSPGVMSGDGVVIVHEPPTEETLRAAVVAILKALDPNQIQAIVDRLPSVWSTKPAELVIQAIVEALK